MTILTFQDLKVEDMEGIPGLSPISSLAIVHVC